MTASKLEAGGPDAEGESTAPTSALDSLIAEARTLLAHRESPDPETFDDPLAFIRDDHARQLRMCNLLDAFTEKLELEPVMPLASALLDYVRGDLPLHTQDEEEDLRPDATPAAEGPGEDAVKALIALGFSVQDAETRVRTALESASEDATVGELVRLASRG